MYLLTIIAVLFMSAMPSYAVYADGGTGDETTPTEPADPPPTDPEAEEPAGTEVEDPAEEPLVDEADPPAEEIPAEETPSPAEVLEMVPEGTDLVVVNEDGDREPLASEAAAEALIEGDPVWCPEGQAPTPGNNGCTPSQTGFDNLIAELSGGTYSGNGVIWVESTYDPNEDSADIDLRNDLPTELPLLGDLTILGGWDGVSGSTSVDPTNPSTLDDRLRIINWTGNVSVSNLTINAGARHQLLIMNDGDISVDNVNVTGASSGSGAFLDNCGEFDFPCTRSGDVTVTNSDFSGNTGQGLIVHSGGQVEIKDSTANNNSANGILANGHSTAGSSLTIKNTTASDNTLDGINASNYQGDVKLSDTTTDNNRDGILVDTTYGNVSGTNITANLNSADGVDIDNTNGSVYLGNVTASDNTDNGVEVYNADGGAVLKCVTAANNGGDGVYVGATDNVTVKCSTITDNTDDGVDIDLAVNAQVLSVTSTGSGDQDLEVDPTTNLTEKKIDCSGKKKKPSTSQKGPWTKLYCLPSEIKVALYDNYGDKVEFDNLCGYEAGVFDPNSWVLPEELPGGGEDYILSLQERMLESIPEVEPVTDYGLPGIIAQVLDELPFMLPNDFSYVSAFFTAVVDDGDELVDPLPEEAGLTVRFRVPEWLDAHEALTILWWDGADWVDLGGEYSEDGYYFQVTTEETGVFVLATYESDS
jgi:hypothetical protein